jgi:GAF domain-containing protein
MEASSVTTARCHRDAASEPQRLASLAASGLLSRNYAALDHITERARQIMNTEVGAVTVILHDEQHMLSAAGTEPEVTARELSVCTHVVASGQPLMLTDTARDPAFAAHPLMDIEGGIRSYCGIPITLADGHVAGALCVFDSRARQFTYKQLEQLAELVHEARAILLPEAPAQADYNHQVWMREDPLADWIERNVPAEDELRERRRRCRLARRFSRAA